MSAKPYYSDDLVALYHGDCREITAWLAADILVTDPPYGQSLVHESRFTHCSLCGRPSRSRYGAHAECRDRAAMKKTVSIVGDRSTDLRDAVLSLWGNRPALVFGTWKADRPEQTRQVIIWDKSDGNGPGPGSMAIPWGNTHEEIYVLGDPWDPQHRSSSVIRIPSYNSQALARPDHPAPKPVGLIEHLVAECPNGVIADPFAGAGSALVAARRLGRRCIGVEIEERYCEIAARRLDQGVLDFGESA